MFESSLMVGVTEWGLRQCQKVQPTYNKESWEPLPVHFRRPEANGADGKPGFGNWEAAS